MCVNVFTCSAVYDRCFRKCERVSIHKFKHIHAQGVLVGDVVETRGRFCVTGSGRVCISVYLCVRERCTKVLRTRSRVRVWVNARFFVSACVRAHTCVRAFCVVRACARACVCASICNYVCVCKSSGDKYEEIKTERTAYPIRLAGLLW